MVCHGISSEKHRAPELSYARAMRVVDDRSSWKSKYFSHGSLILDLGLLVDPMESCMQSLARIRPSAEIKPSCIYATYVNSTA